MKTRLLLLAGLLYAVTSFGQLFGPPDDIPKDYWKSLDRSQKKEVKEILNTQEAYQKANEDRFDFFIPEVPLPVPDGRIYSGNTWYYDYHQTPENAARMVSMAKGKYVCFILDTGEPSYDSVLKTKYPGHTSKSFTGEPVPDGHSHATNIAGSQTFKDVVDNMGVASPLAISKHFYQAYYKVCTNGGGCNYSWIASGIREATQYYLNELKPKGIRAGISMSLGGGSPSAAVNSAIEDAVDAGMIIFASSGNNGQYNISYPAEHPDVYAIGAHDQNGKYTYFSNKGNATEKLFAVGSGLSIYSTCKGNTKCTMSGTSMGNPIANAIIGAIACIKPSWSWDQIINHVSKYSEDLGDAGYDPEHGYGSPRWTALLDALEDQPDDPDPPTCNDGKQNGDEKGIDCGGSCPPCEDNPPPNPGKDFPERILPISIKGQWPVAWIEVQTNAVQPYVYELSGLEGFTSQGDGLILFEQPTTSATNWLDITEIVIRTKSTEDAAISSRKIKNLMNDMWKGNRGVGLPYPADFDLAGRMASYFTDLLADIAYGGIEISIESITFNDRSGNELTYKADELEHWPRGSLPFGYDITIGQPEGANNLIPYKDNSDSQKPSFPTTWEITANWYSDVIYEFGGGAIPKYEKELPYSWGEYTTTVKSKKKPTKEQIERRAPYNRNWKVGEILRIRQLN